MYWRWLWIVLRAWDKVEQIHRRVVEICVLQLKRCNNYKSGGSYYDGRYSEYLAAAPFVLILEKQTTRLEQLCFPAYYSSNYTITLQDTQVAKVLSTTVLNGFPCFSFSWMTSLMPWKHWRCSLQKVSKWLLRGHRAWTFTTILLTCSRNGTYRSILLGANTSQLDENSTWDWLFPRWVCPPPISVSKLVKTVGVQADNV